MFVCISLQSLEMMVSSFVKYPTNNADWSTWVWIHGCRRIKCIARFSGYRFLAPVGLKAKPQEEAATVAAVSRSEDAADSNMYGSYSACCVLTPPCSGINKRVNAAGTFTWPKSRYINLFPAVVFTFRLYIFEKHRTNFTQRSFLFLKIWERVYY